MEVLCCWTERGNANAQRSRDMSASPKAGRSVSAPKQNQNAKKDEADKASSFLHIRATREDKARWVHAANAKRLDITTWVTDVLNRASGN
jgi:hypothetical protein